MMQISRHKESTKQLNPHFNHRGPLTVRRNRSNRGAASIAEFGAALSLLFLFSFVGIGMARAIYALVAGQAITQYLADVAAKSITFDDGINKCAFASSDLTHNGLGAYSGLTPSAGHKNSGVSLHVVWVDAKTEVLKQVDLAEDVDKIPALSAAPASCSYRVVTHYTLSPLFHGAFSSLVPYLGKPLELTFSTTKPIEHPQHVIAMLQNKVVK